jgi:hypothetical protein
MRLSWIKCWIAILCLALITGSLLGCSIITSNRTPVVDGVIDTSKYVKLSMYLIGPPSGDSTMDYQSIVEELNGKRPSAYVMGPMVFLSSSNLLLN